MSEEQSGASIEQSPKSSRYPVVRITGGPHGKNTHITIDGEPMRGVYELELTAGAQDVIRLTTRQIVVVEADLEVTNAMHVGSFGGSVRLKRVRIDESGGEFYSDDVTIAEGSGAPSLPALLRSMADAIEERQEELQNVHVVHTPEEVS